MAYDFSNVSAITIPEGSVKKITDSSGNVLWQKVIVIENEPVQKGTLTYTGSELSPEWYYYDETMMTCTGGNVRTNAGTYFAVFKPNDGYCWSDGSVDYKTIRWTIGKAAGSVSISPTTLTLNSDATSGTITVTRAGDGAISAVSSDTSVATVSVSDNVVTVNSVDSTPGTATITISVAAGTNHTAPSSVTCEVTAEFLLSFSIDVWGYLENVTYMEEGMTWGDWIASSYATEWCRNYDVTASNAATSVFTTRGDFVWFDDGNACYYFVAYSGVTLTEDNYEFSAMQTDMEIIAGTHYSCRPQEEVYGW